MKLYRKSFKINYNNNIFQVLFRNDNKVAILKVNYDEAGNQTYSMPTAMEYLSLTAFVNLKEKYK